MTMVITESGNVLVDNTTGESHEIPEHSKNTCARFANGTNFICQLGRDNRLTTVKFPKSYAIIALMILQGVDGDNITLEFLSKMVK